VTGAGAVVLLGITVPLYAEFREPGLTIWNILLVLILAGVAIAAFFLQLFFLGHAGELGEARFDTRNKDGGNG
jgi:ABC-type glycerol-3-phosphate transport system permease component